MKASKLKEILEDHIKTHGDCEVYMTHRMKIREGDSVCQVSVVEKYRVFSTKTYITTTLEYISSHVQPYGDESLVIKGI